MKFFLFFNQYLCLLKFYKFSLTYINKFEDNTTILDMNLHKSVQK